MDLLVDVKPEVPATGSRSGLTGPEAVQRLREEGPNELRPTRVPRSGVRILEHFRDPVIWLLLGACVASAALGEALDAVVIIVILVVNAVVGWAQEHKAERAITALGAMTAPRARVLRDGHQQVIPAREVVRGDLLVLEAGEIVAADARLLEAHGLSINEAPLTGESLPVSKSVARITTPDAPLADRQDRVFMGTSVVTGTAIACVEATGMAGELGQIARLLETAEESETPLQRRLASLGRALALSSGGLVLVVFGLGLARGSSLADMFLSAVSLAVAAVPEGLPVVVTIALAVGVQRMATRHVLVRQLAAVETLGCATVICTDKTGTLTTGLMAVRELWGPDHDLLLRTAAACCDAELGSSDRAGVGDPTELAILAAAEERGIDRRDIEAANPRVLTTPFDSEARYMSITRQDGVTYIKGALDVLEARASHDLHLAHTAHAQMASRGLRVLAVGTSADVDGPIEVSGLLGFADPPRTDAIQAVAAARRAGIRTVMITGDHPTTAQAIAWELGILGPNDDARSVVHARATPADKLEIVREWKRRGAIVAMTGDGVNDAPALREAHVGIAMGLTGTEVARESADMVLADDNFASIVTAIHEGRAIFENIRKTLVYLLTGNVAELAVMLVAALAGLPLPLLPLHLLWINVITDGLPALALVMDPAGDELLGMPPRDPDEPILGRRQWRIVASTGAVEAGITLATFVWVLGESGLDAARGMAFSTLVFSELFRAFAARSVTRTFWHVGPLSNVRLIAVVAVSVALQLGLSVFAVTRGVFSLDGLGVLAIVGTAVLGLGTVSALEMHKLIRLWKVWFA